MDLAKDVYTFCGSVVMGIRDCKIFPSEATTFHDGKKGQAGFFHLRL